MLFPTLAFAIFFSLVYPLSWLLAGRPRTWRLFMLLASYIFYGFWDWRFVGLIVLTTLVSAWAARWLAPPPGSACQIDRSGDATEDGRGGLPDARSAGRRRVLLAVLLAFDLGILGWFKYYGFLAGSFNGLARGLGMPARMPLLDILLPVGISFFTFQAISYAVDVYRGQVEPAGLLEVAVYLAFFPQLVAGPIVRASEFLPQLQGHRWLSTEDAGRAAWLICGGLFKKVVVANHLATLVVDPVFGAPQRHGAGEIWLAVYAYAVQIYADFSGYTDMAIGIALLLGFRFPLNFDRPYAARSLTDFWRRWHMTLSRWLRDYLYIPLGGSRAGRARTYRNLILTMLLGGLWHGAAATFVAWGLWHGLWLALERAWREARAGRPPILPAWAGRLVTFHLVCLGWLLFRAEGFGLAGTMLLRGLTVWQAPTLDPAQIWVLALGLALLLLQVLPPAPQAQLGARFARLPLALQGLAVGLLLFLADALGPDGVAPFIYFQF